MDQTTFNIHTLMVIVMALASYLVPMSAPVVNRTALVIGFVPSLTLMAAGAQLQSTGGRPWHYYAVGLIAMFIGPIVTVGIAAFARKVRPSK